MLAGVLIQGVHTVNAKLSNELSPSNPAKTSLFERRLAGGRALVQKESNQQPITEESIPSQVNVSTDKSSLINTQDSLSIPKQSSEVQIKELRPLQIEDIGELVEANNPQLKALSIQIDEAKSLLLAALSARYPKINLLGNGLPEYLSGKQYRNPDFTSTPNTKSNVWRMSLSFQVKWDVIDPARVPEIAAARDSYEKAIDTYMIGLRNTRLVAISQYFLLQRADEGVRIGKQSIKASLISLRDARARYEAGVATKLEVLQAETQLARDKRLLTSKLGEQKITRRKLASILNLPEHITPTAASPPQVMGIWQPSLQESIVAAFKFREELDSLLLEISINNSNANAALASIQPNLSLVNTFTSSRYKGQANTKDVDTDDYGWSNDNVIGLTSTWNIFDGGRAKALYKYNKQKAKASEQRFASKRNDIRKEVEESFFNLETSNQDIATMTREILASRESLRLARLRFQAGVTTQREVVNAQRDLTAAEVRYSDAITSYNTSLAQLRRSTGLDMVKACKPIELPAEKISDDDLTDIPIDPMPVIPACQASKQNEQI